VDPPVSRYKERTEHMKYYYYWKPSLSEKSKMDLASPDQCSPNMQVVLESRRIIARHKSFHLGQSQSPGAIFSSFLHFFSSFLAAWDNPQSPTSVGNNDMRTGHQRARAGEDTGRVFILLSFCERAIYSRCSILFPELRHTCLSRPFFLMCAQESKHTYSS
jgi:hypothetical protein